MDRRRVLGVGVLAVAVIALSVGTGVSRPLVVGAASAPPVAPPPQVGDCLYAGPAGPWDTYRDDGTWEDAAYSRWFASCRDPWFGEVVIVRTQADIETELADFSGGIFDPCAAGASAYLGRPEVAIVDGWYPINVGAGGLDPDRRQLASGPQWLACVLGPPAWGPDGVARDFDPPSQARATESLRGRWDEPGVRDRLGMCETGPPAERTPAFCGTEHDRELLAWGSWHEPTDADALRESCSRQAAMIMMREDPTAAGVLVVDVLVDDNMTGIPSLLTAETTLEPQGSATCTVRAADPGRQLEATVVDLGDRPAPVSSG